MKGYRVLTGEFILRDGTPSETYLEPLRWRTGRKVGRTIYAMSGLEPSDDDELIGVMDTPELAADAVIAHNGQMGRV